MRDANCGGWGIRATQGMSEGLSAVECSARGVSTRGLRDIYACPYVPARVKVSLTVKWHSSPARRPSESAQKILTVGRQGLITRGQLYDLWYC